MNVDIKSSPSQIKSLKFRGKINSIEFMSLLNLFKIRPIGVDSKNDNFDRIIVESIFLCNFRDEKSTMLTEKYSAAIENISIIYKKKLKSKLF